MSKKSRQELEQKFLDTFDPNKSLYESCGKEYIFDKGIKEYFEQYEKLVNQPLIKKLNK
tara:strand:+ start:72 stop:248 length:177 start_codon:yes stop_codon:yes gene_type:complete